MKVPEFLCPNSQLMKNVWSSKYIPRDYPDHLDLGLLEDRVLASQSYDRWYFRHFAKLIRALLKPSEQVKFDRLCSLIRSKFVVYHRKLRTLCKKTKTFYWQEIFSACIHNCEILFGDYHKIYHNQFILASFDGQVLERPTSLDVQPSYSSAAIHPPITPPPNGEKIKLCC